MPCGFPSTPNLSLLYLLIHIVLLSTLGIFLRAFACIQILRVMFLNKKSATSKHEYLAPFVLITVFHSIFVVVKSAVLVVTSPG